MTNPILVEEFIEKLKADVYPITIIKFILNRKKIINCFERVKKKDFKIKHHFKIDHSDCNACINKINDGVLCRQHTSIQRVLNPSNILHDVDTDLYFYKNEIYKIINGKLVIVYCPHSKLIEGDITDSKVRKIIPITVDDDIPEIKSEMIIKFFSSMLMNEHMKCWFNNEFSIITTPNNMNSANWCLVANKK